MRISVKRWLLPDQEDSGLFVVQFFEGEKAFLTLQELTRFIALAEVEIREYITSNNGVPTFIFNEQKETA